MNYKNIVLLASLSAFNFSGFCSEAKRTPQEEIAVVRQCIADVERQCGIVCEAIKRQAAIDGTYKSRRYFNLLVLLECKQNVIQELRIQLEKDEVKQLNEELKNGTLL